MIAYKLAYRVQPHLIDISSVLVLWKLNAPLPSLSVLIVFPCGNDTILHETSIITDDVKHERPPHLEKIVVSPLWQLRWGNNIIV